MLSNWENKFRDHWPHHYRDVLDKVNSPLGLVVVSDTEAGILGCEKPVVTLEKSFRAPHIFKIKVQDPISNKFLSEKQYEEASLDQAIEDFITMIGSWKQK
jgi:hypothetical protein